MVVCPTMLVGAVELVLMSLKKLTLAGSASTRLRLVPSTPMTNTFGVSTEVTPICGPLVALRRKVLRSSSSRTAPNAAKAAGASAGGVFGCEFTSGAAGFTGRVMSRTSGSAVRVASADNGLVLAVRVVVVRAGDAPSASELPVARVGLADFRSLRPGDFESDDTPAPEEPEAEDDAPALDELEELLDEDSPVSANADGADASATPTPRVTAKAPIRPMCLA